jgi:predicted nucleic acid-binding protein
MHWEPAPVSAGILQVAWRIEDRHGLSWWDSLIVASALAQDCRTLLTEDLQDGLEIEGMRVLNPFAPGFHPDDLD